MISNKQSALRSLLESKDGIHLSAYLDRSKGLASLEGQLRETIDVASQLLSPALKPPEVDRFLEPVRNIIKDRSIFKEMTGNIGLFRTATSFRVLNIPVDVEQICVVATSFHVKPLLRWMQIDRDFLLLGLDGGAASLYQGSQLSFRFIGSILFPQSPRETIGCLNDWLADASREIDHKPRLFVAGEPALTKKIQAQLFYENVHAIPLSSHFRTDAAAGLCSEVRNILRQDARRALEGAIVEFYHAEELKLGKRNIFQIAKAAIQGRVRKLIIADGINIFGKIDPKTGGLAIYPAELDHEDDDLLDDLAQTVLEKGGEVLVARREEIPKGHPILAIVDRPLAEKSTIVSEENPPSDWLHRRTV